MRNVIHKLLERNEVGISGHETLRHDLASGFHCELNPDTFSFDRIILALRINLQIDFLLVGELGFPFLCF